MVTLVLDRTNLELRIEGDALAVYRFGEYHGSIPLKLLERVVLQGMIQFDADVLGALAEAGVPAVILGSCCIAVLDAPNNDDENRGLSSSSFTLRSTLR